MEKQKLRKIITIGTIFTSIVTIINLGVKYALPLYLRLKFSIESNEAPSIGIIGGADGPTAIFITSNYDTNYIAIVFGLLSIAGTIYLIFNKKVIK